MFLLSLIPMQGNVVFPDFTGWKLQEDQRIYTGKDLWELIDGAADIFLSYDFKDLRIPNTVTRIRSSVWSFTGNLILTMLLAFIQRNACRIILRFLSDHRDIKARECLIFWLVIIM